MRSHTQVELPFTGLTNAEALAVDTPGSVYAANVPSDQVTQTTDGVAQPG